VTPAPGEGLVHRPRVDSLRAVFAGRRGRLLVGLLLAEFAAAVQVVAYSAVLPLASRELSGQRLYGATVAAGSIVTVFVLALGPGLFARVGPARTLAVGTGLYLGGVLAAALAPAMGWMLAGSVLRGVASGLLLGVGLTAIGGLYEDALRPRVLGLFAIMWLLPSIAGPALTSLVAAAAGWRWAMAWPAVLVLAARLLVIRDAGLIPWQPSTGRLAPPPSRARLAPGNGLLVVAGLLGASVSSGIGGRWSALVFAAGLLVAVYGGARVLSSLPVEPSRIAVVRAFALLCLAFFGAETLVPLLVVEGLGFGVVAAGVALGAGLVAWSLTGLRAPRLRDPALVGIGLIVAALLAMSAAAYGSVVGLGLVVGGFAIAGFGMGLAYPRLMAQAFDDLPAETTAGVATAVGFAEVAGTAVGSLLGGGLYSLADSLGVGASPAIAAAYVLLAVVAALSLRRTLR